MFSFTNSPRSLSPEDDKLLYAQYRSASQDTDERNTSFNPAIREVQRGHNIWPWIMHLGLVCVYTTVTFLVLESYVDLRARSDCDTKLYCKLYSSPLETQKY